jgi:adenosylhomocysteinase
MSQIKDPSLAEKGKMSYEWARDPMKILTNAIERLKRSQPLREIRIGICLNITKETSV